MSAQGKANKALANVSFIKALANDKKVPAFPVHLNALVMGPSFSIARQNDAFGFRTAYRTVASGRDVPYEVVPFSYEGLSYEPLQRRTVNISYRGGNIVVKTDCNNGFTYRKYNIVTDK